MYINASMIHELRMVILHGAKLLKRSRTARPKKSAGLVCLTCIRQRFDPPNNAITIKNGNALCLEHIY